MVFAKACNLYPDLGVVPGKFDFTLHGCTVDVKTTKYPNGKLLVSHSKKLEDCDVYVLITGSMPSYVIAGWMYNHEIINEDHVDDSPTHRVPRRVVLVVLLLRGANVDSQIPKFLNS